MERYKIAALKRSFEVEDVDSTSHSSSPHTHRAPTNSQRSAISPTSGRYYELGSNGTKPPETSRPKARTPEPRRTELGFDISSINNGKAIDGSPSPGTSRFGLKRPNVLGHSKTPEMHKHSVTFSKTLETIAPITRAASTIAPHASAKLPETTFRKSEPPSPGEVLARKPEISITKATNIKDHDSYHHPPVTTRCPSLNHAGRKSPGADGHRPEVITSLYGSMADAGKTPVARGEKSSTEFGYVGIDAILEQMRRKAMKQGFEFNIMVVGQSGLGKSTLMNTLFKSKVSRRSVMTTDEERITKTIEIKTISHDIEEKGVRMKLTVIDTPGFGDQINNENCWQPIMKFINAQYEQYLQEEINIDRKKRIPDSRVHCCIYFIPPTGHCLRPIDIEFMRHLSKVVNIVPVIAKADTLTLEERDFFKQKIREDLRANEIEVYPQKEFDEDAEDRLINEKIREMIPFAVVGSDQEYQVNGKRLLGRKTRWGTVEVENIAHCEFSYLRDLLIRTHMQNIKDITSSIHYEMYRIRRLNENNTQTNGQPAIHANGVTELEVLSHEM
ncbi:neuronal-specific septin-3-like isoform X2 [Myxocyprinus asiaticus]|uniref:neuronal-specific septin-3-like isoform X2 n=1 Tax=Myxocyprinus asiaticus TaxID=70543 RepID=UPI002223131D|nr:neuronal-specific septin-3-like isoform X2 [Myxocyprinus asiaticus]